ncbi:MAG: sarcosine oxidase subunit gamma, partial [Alphaproteobacteria bacterium]
MAEGESPLAGHIAPGDHGDRRGDPGVVPAERPIAALVQVCAWPDTVDRVAGIIAAVAGCP